jgi:hypothetical protein
MLDIEDRRVSKSFGGLWALRCRTRFRSEPSALTLQHQHLTVTHLSGYIPTHCVPGADIIKLCSYIPVQWSMQSPGLFWVQIRGLP